MGKRVFVFTQSKFPRGDAGSNRILYMMKVFKEIGYEPIIISYGRSRKEDFIDGKYTYQGITYSNIVRKKDHISKLFGYLFLDEKQMSNIALDYKINSEDIAIIYSSIFSFIANIMSFLRRQKVRTYIDLVEWYQPFQFKNGIINPRYLSFITAFKFLAHKTGYNIVISNLLYDEFIKRGNNVTLLPVFIDSKEYKFIPKRNSSKIKLIYPGFPGRKDNFEKMLLALNELTEQERKNIEFHITGSSEKELSNILSDKSLINKLEGVLQIHKWMEYEELTDLYSDVDFLFQIRDNTRVTQANFPSKIPELMARGISVIANDIGDFPSYLSNGKDSMIFSGSDPKSATDILRKVIQMTSDEVLSYKVNARKTAESVFDYRNWKDKILYMLEK